MGFLSIAARSGALSQDLASNGTILLIFVHTLYLAITARNASKQVRKIRQSILQNMHGGVASVVRRASVHKKRVTVVPDTAATGPVVKNAVEEYL